MILYLLKSTGCLAILLVFYYLFLEKEKMHGFKRYYLLLCLILAVTIPLIQIENAPLPELMLVQEAAQDKDSGVDPLVSSATAGQRNENLPAAALAIIILYSTGVLLMGLRFIKNLLRLKAIISRNTIIKYQNARLVLLRQPQLPYTFLHYIFVNRKDYENQQIENELLTHELAHVRQKHSLDILFIQLLQVVCWFNPLLYLVERAIKLNHEFLADAYAIKACKDVGAYQQLLLKKVLSNHRIQLSSHLNYSLTKTRFSMMTKSSTQMSITLKKTALLPLLAAIIFVFSSKTLAQKESEGVDITVTADSHAQVQHVSSAHNDSLQQVKEIIYKSVRFKRKNKEGKLVEKSYDELTEKEKEELPIPNPPREQVPTQNQLDSWMMDAEQFGVWLDGERIDNKVLENYEPADFGKFYVSRLHKNAANYGRHTYQVDLSTKEHFEDFRQSWLKRFEHLK